MKERTGELEEEQEQEGEERPPTAGDLGAILMGVQDSAGNAALAGLVAQVESGQVPPEALLAGNGQTADKDADVVRCHHDVGMRHQLQELAADRGDGVDNPAWGVDRCAIAHHSLGEHRVGHAPREEDLRLHVWRTVLARSRGGEEAFSLPQPTPTAGKRRAFPG